MFTSLILGTLLSCSSTVIDPAWRDDRFFQISGAVNPDLVLDEGDIYGGLIWIWHDQERWRSVVERSPFEARLLSYRMGVPSPPSESNTPTEGAPVEPLLIGLPIVYQGLIQSVSAFNVNAEATWRWVINGGDLSGAISLDEGHIVGLPSDYLVMALRTGAQPASCGFDQVSEGLTLYRADGDSCALWRPLAPAGSRTEFQGVDLWPLDRSR